MTGKTHLAAGAVLALTVGSGSIGSAAGIILGSVLPDIDSPHSFLGQYIPVLPKLLPHRTVTHSLLFAALTALLSPWVSMGVLLHLLLDSMNPMGIRPLWPLQVRLRIPLLCKVAPQGGKVDYAIGFVCCLASVVLTCRLLLRGPLELPALPWESV